MDNQCDAQLNQLLITAINSLDNFMENFHNSIFISDYFLVLDDIFNMLDTPGIKFASESFQKVQQHYKDNAEEDSEEEHIKWRRKGFTWFLLRNSPVWGDKLEEDDTIWEAMDRYIVEGTMNEYNSKMPLYYKNFMPTEKQSEFESIVDLIRNELISYHMNLTYSKKIIDFLDNEFSKDGAFPTQIIFLRQYLKVATSEMILVSTKLFSPTNTQKNISTGFQYLKNYIAKNCGENSDVKNILGKEIRALLKDGTKKCETLVKLRNALIAHYDINKIGEIKDFCINYNELKELYELSVTILQKLSFYRFERMSCVYPNLIRCQGFEKAVCQNPWMSCARLDIDDYFSMLRQFFTPNLMKKSEILDNNSTN